MTRLLPLLMLSSWTLATGSLSEIIQAGLQHAYDYQSSQQQLLDADFDALSGISALLPYGTYSVNTDTLTINEDLSPSTLVRAIGLQQAQRASVAQRKKTEAEQILKVAGFYLDLVSAQKKLQSLQFEHDSSQARYEQVKAGLSQGLHTQTDLLSFKASKQNSYVKMIAQKALITKLRANLELLTGMSLKKIRSFSNKKPIHLTCNINSGISWDIVSAQKNLDAKQTAALAQEGQLFMPTIGYLGTRSSDSTWTHSLQFTWNFDISAKKTIDSQKARNQEKVARLQYQYAKANGKSQQQTLSVLLKSDAEQTQASQVGYQAATKRYQSALASYKAGQVDQIALKSAIEDVTKARDHMIDAQIIWCKDYLAWHKENGQLSLATIKKLDALFSLWEPLA